MVFRAVVLFAAILVAGPTLAQQQPIVTKGQAFDIFAHDRYAREAGLTPEVFRCLAQPRGRDDSAIGDMINPRGLLYGEVQPHLAMIRQARAIEIVPRGRLVDFLTDTSPNAAAWSMREENKRLKDAFGKIGDASTILSPSALGLFELVANKTLGALHGRLRRESLSGVYDAYVAARNTVGGDPARAEDHLDYLMISDRNLYYQWNTLVAEMDDLARALNLRMPGERLLRTTLRWNFDKGRERISTDGVIESIVRGQAAQAARDSARAIAENPDLYNCVENPNYVYPPAGGGFNGRAPDSAALDNCLCGCNRFQNGRLTEFSCSYNTSDYPGFSQGGSPSCANPANGPCLCRAFGCFRAQPVRSGSCYADCMSKHGG